MDDREHATRSNGAVTLWSVTWQAALGREFFVAPSLYDRIRSRLVSAHRRPGRVLIDYLLLPAEIHVLSELPLGDNARSVARDVGSMVSRWVREIQPVRSPVMAGPYRSLVITSLDALRSEVRMLAWRPVFLSLCATPFHYSHGTLRIALGLARAQGFETRPLLQLFGPTISEARFALRRWIARRPSEAELQIWEMTRGLALVAGVIASGSGAMRNDTAALIAAGRTNDVKGALLLLETWVAAKQLTLSESNKVHVQSPLERALVGCLAVQHHLCSASAIARYFGKAKSTLSEQMKACRSRANDAAILRTPLWRIISEYTALKESDARE